MFRVYVLMSEITGRHYTGSCEDLEDRLHRHNSGQSPATRHGTPWKLIHSEVFRTRAEAVRRERFLKTGRGREELQALLGRAPPGWSGRRGDRPKVQAHSPRLAHKTQRVKGLRGIRIGECDLSFFARALGVTAVPPGDWTRRLHRVAFIT